jgi:hypothetical protein
VIGRVLLVTAIASACALAAACSRPDNQASNHPTIRLVTPRDGSSVVEVSGLTSATLDTLRRSTLNADQWSSLLRVAVADEGPAVLGQYHVTSDSLRFTPAFPFEDGRTYKVRFDASRIPGATSSAPALVSADVGRPARIRTPSTVVARVYPSGDEVPENLLRIYIEFSAPMARRNGLEHLHLLDDRGQEVTQAFLPLDTEFWSRDNRRLTVFFDPGRVKDGILPNQQMGRALRAGRTYTLVIAQGWQDAEGQPLAHEYRHRLRVGHAQESALVPASWRLSMPEVGSRDPLTVTFPQPLDEGLLLRALGVRSGDAPVEGDIRTENGETRWVFTPDSPWRAGRYELLALAILEDAAGNRIGRAFEIENRESVDKAPTPQPARLPFTLRSRGTN